jgi:pimeloyl-ACP methyl ester carboxylesterase
MPQLDIHHVSTFYQRIGHSKKTLLLLHGWRNDWQSWASLIPLLSQEYSLLIPDLPGFGQSGTPKSGWATNDYRQWLRAFLESQNITQLEGVIGHSYGAKLAGFTWLTSHATSFPKLKSGLFLIGASGIPAHLSFPKRVLQTSLSFVPGTVKRQVLSGLRTKLYSWLDADADYFHASPFQETTLQRILSEDIRKAVLHPVTTRLHLCWGEHDNASPLWMAYHWQKLSDHSDVFVVPNTGHFPHHENPALITPWLKTWLNEKESV